ncbi:MAG TPA: hypothetical protein VFS43_46550 [Polyangiaceae bacterium]|nr:hypothetical protein [Polyangiaceae bacterium]
MNMKPNAFALLALSIALGAAACAAPNEPSGPAPEAEVARAGVSPDADEASTEVVARGEPADTAVLSICAWGPWSGWTVTGHYCGGAGSCAPSRQGTFARRERSRHCYTADGSIEESAYEQSTVFVGCGCSGPF